MRTSNAEMQAIAREIRVTGVVWGDKDNRAEHAAASVAKHAKAHECATVSDVMADLALNRLAAARLLRELADAGKIERGWATLNRRRVSVYRPVVVKRSPSRRG